MLVHRAPRAPVAAPSRFRFVRGAGVAAAASPAAHSQTAGLAAAVSSSARQRQSVGARPRALCGGRLAAAGPLAQQRRCAHTDDGFMAFFVDALTTPSGGSVCGAMLAVSCLFVTSYLPRLVYLASAAPQESGMNADLVSQSNRYARAEADARIAGAMQSDGQSRERGTANKSRDLAMMGSAVQRSEAYNAAIGMGPGHQQASENGLTDGSFRDKAAGGAAGRIGSNLLILLPATLSATYAGPLDLGMVFANPISVFSAVTATFMLQRFTASRPALGIPVNFTLYTLGIMWMGWHLVLFALPVALAVSRGPYLAVRYAPGLVACIDKVDPMPRRLDGVYAPVAVAELPPAPAFTPTPVRRLFLSTSPGWRPAWHWLVDASRLLDDVRPPPAPVPLSTEEAEADQSAARSTAHLAGRRVAAARVVAVAEEREVERARRAAVPAGEAVAVVGQITTGADASLSSAAARESALAQLLGKC